MPHKTAEQDFGLLQAIDERLAMYGWLTNTGVKFVIVIDMEGRPATLNETKINSAVGIRDADLKPVSSQTCPYEINILMNTTRRFELSRLHISTCSETLSMILMSTLLPSLNRNAERDPLKSRAKPSSRKSPESAKPGHLDWLHCEYFSTHTRSPYQSRHLQISWRIDSCTMACSSHANCAPP